jgi:hypothetical protein
VYTSSGISSSQKLKAIISCENTSDKLAIGCERQGLGYHIKKHI